MSYEKNLTEIVFVLDRSGSMKPLEEDTIGGFTEFIEKQRKIEGEAYITTVQFDTSYQVLHEHVALDEVKPLTKDDYSARGGTALLDAVGRTIDNLGVRLSNTPEEERPEHVIFVITTDGEENSSMSYSLQKVREMIAHQQENTHGSLFSSAQIWTPFPKPENSGYAPLMQRISPPVTAASEICTVGH